MLVARLHPRRIVLAAHLDTSRLVDGEPDPAWTMTQEYPLGQDDQRLDGETETAHAQRIASLLGDVIDDMTIRCQVRRGELDDIFSAGLPLPEEGQPF